MTAHPHSPPCVTKQGSSVVTDSPGAISISLVESILFQIGFDLECISRKQHTVLLSASLPLLFRQEIILNMVNREGYNL